MKIINLDRGILGFDIDVSIFDTLGDVTSYDYTKKEETKERIKNADIVITNEIVITKEDMEDSNIKLICISATGMNHVDLEYAQEKGIEVKNVAGYSSSSVSQVAFAMIFHFVQKLNYYELCSDFDTSNEPNTLSYIENPFFELDGKRVGVIGLGDIGERFAKRARVFDCEVVYYSTSGRNNNSEFKKVELDELLRTSDIISIHCPLNKQTENLLNYENMNTMKDGTILLNLGRGGVINEDDLSVLIDEKEIYCGIDVVNKEPIEEFNPLLKVKNKDRLLLTPHIGWGSVESRTRLIGMVAENIKEFMR